MAAAQPTGPELAALARALVAAMPTGDDVVVLSPESLGDALTDLGAIALMQELLAGFHLTTESATGLIVAFVGLSWNLLHRLANALGRPVGEVRSELFAEMAAAYEGFERPT